jgi:hypothetical protein
MEMPIFSAVADEIELHARRRELQVSQPPLMRAVKKCPLAVGEAG